MVSDLPQFVVAQIQQSAGIIPPRFWFSNFVMLLQIWCEFFGCAFMMQISYSTIFQRCFIGLKPGDCGDVWSEGNSLSCSRLDDLSFVTQLVVMLKDVYTVVTREGHG